MAPTRSKKRKSTDSETSIDMQSFPAPPQLVPTKTRSPARTPTNRSPIRKATMGITFVQKQALMDNLQLEITDRARKLRAQYGLQAQGLRTRIEIRVNRIPMALRKTNMEDLLLRHSQKAPNALLTAARTSPAKNQSPPKTLIRERQNYQASTSPQRGTKRLSDGISSTDKENEDIENPKKRLRGPPEPPIRTTSKIQTSQVLSPRSANSRTITRSPARPTPSPGKSYIARPASPVKPAGPAPPSGAASTLANMVERAKSTRGKAAASKETEQSATIGRGKRAAAPAVPPKVGRGRPVSDSSDTSAGTTNTIVRKPVPVAPKKAPAKRTVMSTIKGMGGGVTKNASATKAAAPSTGTRVLRKRH